MLHVGYLLPNPWFSILGRPVDISACYRCAGRDLYHSCREWVGYRLGIAFRHSNADQRSSKSQKAKRLRISAIRSSAHNDSRCSDTTSNSFDFLCNCFIVKFGEIYEDFCSAFFHQLFLTSLINSNDSHCHTTTSDLTSQVALGRLVCDLVRDSGEEITRPPPAPAIVC